MSVSNREAKVVGNGATRTKLSTFFITVMVVTTSQFILSVYHAHTYLDFTTDNSSTSSRKTHDIQGQLGKFQAEKEARLSLKEVKVKNTPQTSAAAAASPKNLILTRIEEAGIPLTPEIIDRIPPFSQVQQVYGDKPIILGLEQCEEFRRNLDPAKRFFGSAGYVYSTNQERKELGLHNGPVTMFNTGTNLLYELMNANCVNQARLDLYGGDAAGIRWQVPWGKHSPVSYRGKHKAETGNGLIELQYLPVVIIKDPYTWMQSLCRNGYTATWPFKKAHCPNLVPNKVDKSAGFVVKEEDERMMHKNGIPIKIKYNPNTTTYRNMADAWNTWNGDYFNVDFPRLIVRFEDVLLHANAVVTQVCHCIGGTLKNETNFQYIAGSAKKAEMGHKVSTSGFVEALVIYTNTSNRVKSFTRDDLVFANSALNGTMMNMLSYTFASTA